MIDQQPQFTIAELGAKFGALQGQILAQTLAELITLEKMVQTLQSQIQAMTKNEARFIEHIQDIEEQLAELKVANDNIPHMSEEMIKIASEGSAVIADKKEIAALSDG